MKLIATLAAKEKTLRTAIGAMLMPAPRAHLRSVARVYPLYAHTPLLCFVKRQGVELGKGPTMQFPLIIDVLVLLAASHLGGISDVGQVLKDDGAARGSILDDALGEDMITVPVESLLPLRKLLQVTFRGLCSFGLEFSPEAKVTAVNLFPMFRAKKLMLGGHSRSREAKINSDHFPCRVDSRFRHMHHDMQPPFPLTIDEVSSGNLVSCVASAEMGNRKGNAESSSTTRELNRLCLPVQEVGMFIVADRTELALRHLDGLKLGNWLATLQGLGLLLLEVSLMLLLPRQGTLESLSSLDASLNEQVTDQARTSRLGSVVSGMMQLYPVLFLVLPAIGAHGIERLGKLSKCLMQGLNLERCRMQVYSHSSVHTNTVPYMSTFCQQEKGEAAFLPA